MDDQGKSLNTKSILTKVKSSLHTNSSKTTDSSSHYIFGS